jgi:hypothetical protein
MPMKVAEYGVRDCFIPRPGNVFIDADIEALELCTLAQIEIWCLKNHVKAKQINSGLDLHSITGAAIAGVTYAEFRRRVLDGDKEFKNIRNLSKVPGFGKPGGMADTTLVSFARTSYGIKLGATSENPRPCRELQEAEAIRIGGFWRDANPNDQEYLEFIRTCRRGDRYEVIIGHPSIGSVVRRGKATYCAAANSLFQGLGAIAAGEITWEIQKACYATPGSPLFGCRLVVHAYDEWLLECPLGRQTEAGEELSRIIRVAGARKVPDVGFRADTCAMVRWIKSAERVLDASGNLLIWGTPECDAEFKRQQQAKKEKKAA